ncbi:MAG: N(4)-(beta-N-acetylglucosaminyl)-L-asparaginase [Bacteroidetes bacterium]|nr:N(4)-(beta-N-acetylglucosaminyl)-L-asparaginase [Bacteroidota bacterium]
MNHSSRRIFLRNTTLAGSALIAPNFLSCQQKTTPVLETYKPQILSTWNHGMPANNEAWKTLQQTGNIVDAVEQGVRVTESDPDNLSVGLQGLPDRDGIVTLDASIMKGDGSCGSVSFVRQIKHPITLARRVMENTPHVMLSGEGARRFAIAEGFALETEQLSPKAEAAYQKWLENAQYKPVVNVENHDTIGMIGIDAEGRLAGACTTSGLAYKMHGRVGDSPIIGAGLYVDDEVGAATATGLGETIIKICGSFLIVELMRQGRSPQEACEETVRRLVAKSKATIKDVQAGFLAINKDGAFGAYAVQPGFNFAQHHPAKQALVDSQSYFPQHG